MNASEIKVTNKNWDYDLIPSFVKLILDGSYDQNGDYHEYLFDYSYACVVLKICTNYDGEYDFNEVMNIYGSNEEWKQIENEIGQEALYRLYQYAYSEIVERNKPFAKVNVLINEGIKMIESLNAFIEKMDNEKIFEIISQIDIDAINKISTLLGGK